MRVEASFGSICSGLTDYHVNQEGRSKFSAKIRAFSSAVMVKLFGVRTSGLKKALSQNMISGVGQDGKRLETRDIKPGKEGNSNVDGLSSKTPQTQESNQLNEADVVLNLETEELQVEQKAEEPVQTENTEREAAAEPEISIKPKVEVEQTVENDIPQPQSFSDSSTGIPTPPPLPQEMEKTGKVEVKSEDLGAVAEEKEPVGEVPVEPSQVSEESVVETEETVVTDAEQPQVKKEEEPFQTESVGQEVLTEPEILTEEKINETTIQADPLESASKEVKLEDLGAVAEKNEPVEKVPVEPLQVPEEQVVETDETAVTDAKQPQVEKEAEPILTENTEREVLTEPESLAEAKVEVKQTVGNDIPPPPPLPNTSMSIPTPPPLPSEGEKLGKVEVKPKTNTNQHPVGTEALLESIKKGTNLKKPSVDDKRSKRVELEKDNMEILRAAMKERRGDLKEDDNDNSDDDDDGDPWDDGEAVRQPSMDKPQKPVEEKTRPLPHVSVQQPKAEGVPPPPPPPSPQGVNKPQAKPNLQQGDLFSEINSQKSRLRHVNTNASRPSPREDDVTSQLREATDRRREESDLEDDEFDGSSFSEEDIEAIDARSLDSVEKVDKYIKALGDVFGDDLQDIADAKIEELRSRKAELEEQN